jgi:hypothetical protein
MVEISHFPEKALRGFSLSMRLSFLRDFFPSQRDGIVKYNIFFQF